jgi:tetratricopeptide (TPR) repeat protein
LYGLPITPGISCGVVKTVNSADEVPKVLKGDVAVFKHFGPDMTPALKRCSGALGLWGCGGLNGHLAIVVREIAIPCITQCASEKLSDGQVVCLDGYSGEIRILLNVEEIKRILNGRDTEDKHGIGVDCHNSGVIYAARKEWDEAVEYYEKALGIFQKLGDEHGIAVTSRNIGFAYAARKEWDEAVEYYEKALGIFQKLGDEHGIAIIQFNLANIFTNKKEFSNALNLYSRSEEILIRLGDRFNLMTVYHNLCVCYRDLNKEKKAKEYYLKAEELRIQLRLKENFLRRLPRYEVTWIYFNDLLRSL